MYKKTIIFLIVWFIAFATDVICTYTISRPIFVLPLPGGEVISYVGLGYLINIYYPLTINKKRSVFYGKNRNSYSC